MAISLGGIVAYLTNGLFKTDSGSGTVVYPDEKYVYEGIQYGEDGTQFTGTLNLENFDQVDVNPPTFPDNDFIILDSGYTPSLTLESGLVD